MIECVVKGKLPGKALADEPTQMGETPALRAALLAAIDLEIPKAEARVEAARNAMLFI